MQSDLRAVLQYVPFFRGKTFVLVIDAARMPELALAEALLDLIALQQIGVKLVVVSIGNGKAQIDQLLIDGELKWQLAEFEKDQVGSILDRGQLVLIEKPELERLGDELVEFTSSLGAFKLIVFLSEQVSGGNAISSEDARKWDGEGQALLHRAAEVCILGVPRVHLLNENQPGRADGRALLERRCSGSWSTLTTIFQFGRLLPTIFQSYLAMVGRSMRDAHLVPRSYEEIESFA